ncbi:MAG TPA: endonuclease/exonuclease/phosphatase family protein [Bacteroidales bacterium]|nr:endonuclease/exonuclease/phosphatase family protein [Bacteroidales bacterium]
MMSLQNIYKYVSLILPLILMGSAGNAKAQSPPLTFMFYNVENLFYPQDDSTTDADDDFTPAGIRKWTWNRYHNKTAQLCKIILGINGWEPPDVICFCEIENRNVLTDIVNHQLLINYQYRVIHRESPDHRGMDVGMIYREDRIACTDSGWIKMHHNGHLEHTREIMTAEFMFHVSNKEQDTLICFMNHWSSKYGGAIESQPKRMTQASMLIDSIDSIRATYPERTIIAGGDFNERTTEPACSRLSQKGSLREIVPSPEKGTYKYQGRWGRIDHVFMKDSCKKYDVSLTVWHHPFLLEADEKFTGDKPRRTYSGYAYNGGISDHLPLLLKMVYR